MPYDALQLQHEAVPRDLCVLNTEQPKLRVRVSDENRDQLI